MTVSKHPNLLNIRLTWTKHKQNLRINANLLAGIPQFNYAFSLWLYLLITMLMYSESLWSQVRERYLCAIFCAYIITATGLKRYIILKIAWVLLYCSTVAAIRNDALKLLEYIYCAQAVGTKPCTQAQMVTFTLLGCHAQSVGSSTILKSRLNYINWD